MQALQRRAAHLAKARRVPSVRNDHVHLRGRGRDARENAQVRLVQPVPRAAAAPVRVRHLELEGLQRSRDGVVRDLQWQLTPHSSCMA